MPGGGKVNQEPWTKKGEKGGIDLWPFHASSQDAMLQVSWGRDGSDACYNSDARHFFSCKVYQILETKTSPKGSNFEEE